MDKLLLLYNRESNGEHNRQLYVLKSRGMAEGKAMGEALKRMEEAWEKSDYKLTKEELLKK